MSNVLALQDLPDESEAASPPQTGGGPGSILYSVLQPTELQCWVDG